MCVIGSRYFIIGIPDIDMGVNLRSDDDQIACASGLLPYLGYHLSTAIMAGNSFEMG